MKVIKRIAVIALLAFGGLSIDAAVKLPAIISDNMLLQQQTTVNVWGTANPQEKVSVKPSWSEKTYTTITDDNGKWLIKVKTPKATTNQSIEISGENSIIIQNVLIGEVWLCSGQSNMDFQVSKDKGWRTGILNEEEEMKDADYPEIRLFHVTQKLSPEQELDDCEGCWMVCNPENLKDFSAVGFFFGRDLYKKLQVPIGLIQSTWGGTHAESWTKMSVMTSDPVYASLVKDFYTSKENYPADLKKYEDEKKVYDAEKAKGNAELKAPKKPQGIDHNKALSTLWNAMIHPLLPYAIKGAIWYQGESNSIRANDYTHVFTKMINSWRKEWNRGDFPFYFVQIAPHYKQPPTIREAQLNTWKTVKNTGLAVITDVGDSTDIHPRNKLVPGTRLANWALAKTYGQNIPYSGTVYKSMKVKNGKAVLTFEFTDKGLTDPNNNLSGFVIAGNNRQFYPATASIVGNMVEVYSPQVPNPVAVRYDWDKFFRASLFNTAGLPATPFRTDNWIITDK